MTQPDADIVVAGAGHNSLVAAAYLARAGLSVIVLESRDLIGGNTATEEVTLPGFLHDTCATAHNLIQSSPTLRDDELGLAEHGLHYIAPDPVVHMPFPDGASITMWRDRDRTRAELARFSAADAAAYIAALDEYAQVAPIFSADAYTPIGFGPDLDERLGAHPEGARWRHRIALSAWDVIRTTYESEHVRAFMLWMALMTMVPPDQPNSGRLAYALVAGRQRWSWSIPRGGSAALPRALASVIEAHGGQIVTGAHVDRLIVEDGRCTGVRAADGREWRAGRAVLSSLHIKHLVETAPAEHWGAPFLEALGSWHGGICMFGAHYATRAPMRFRTGEGEEIMPSAVGVMPSVDRALRLGSDIARGVVATDAPPLLAICSSAADPSRAPEGHHTLKLVGFHPYRIEGGAGRWDEISDEVAEAHLDHLLSYAPGFTRDDLMARYVKSPLDLERINPANWEGSCHAGAQDPSQSGPLRPVPGWASHRMPIAGLYQTGASTHPGGSVSAGPGRNAAMVMLRDLGLPPIGGKGRPG